MNDMNDAVRPEGSGPEMDELLGAFALDALDPGERAMVERHLANDPVARAEVDEMRETAAALASLPGADAAEGPPPDLWDRIADAIGSSDPATDAASEARRGSSDIIPIARVKRIASVPARVAVPIAAAAALVIAVLAIQVATRSPSRAGDVAAAYNHAVAHGATPVHLRLNGTGPVAADIALQRDGSGYLRSDRLSVLPAGKTYQLWALVGSGNGQRAISTGVLGREPGAAAFHVAGRPDAFALTVENAPGVVAPTAAPMAVGRLPA